MEDPKFARTTAIDIIAINAAGKAFANMEKTSIAAKNVEALNFVSTTSINITAKNALGTAFASITETNIYAKNVVGLPFANTGKIVQMGHMEYALSKKIKCGTSANLSRSVPNS